MSPERMQRIARELDSQTICYIQYAGNAQEKQVATQELTSRGFTCSAADLEAGRANYNAAQARRQASKDAALWGGVQLLNQPQAPVVLPPRAVQCFTHPGGAITCY